MGRKKLSVEEEKTESGMRVSCLSLFFPPQAERTGEEEKVFYATSDKKILRRKKGKIQFFGRVRSFLLYVCVVTASVVVHVCVCGQH